MLEAVEILSFAKLDDMKARQSAKFAKKLVFSMLGDSFEIFRRFFLRMYHRLKKI